MKAHARPEPGSTRSRCPVLSRSTTGPRRFKSPAKSSYKTQTLSHSNLSRLCAFALSSPGNLPYKYCTESSKSASSPIFHRFDHAVPMTYANQNRRPPILVGASLRRRPSPLLRVSLRFLRPGPIRPENLYKTCTFVVQKGGGGRTTFRCQPFVTAPRLAVAPPGEAGFVSIRDKSKTEGN